MGWILPARGMVSVTSALRFKLCPPLPAPASNLGMTLPESGRVPPPGPKMWFIYWDPCGLVCYIFGWFVVLLANYVTIFEVRHSKADERVICSQGPAPRPLAQVLRPWFGFSTKNLTGILHGVIFQSIIVLILWSYARAGFTDPGSVKRGTASPEDAYPPADDPDRPFKPKRRFCPKCNCIKPPRAHHCSTCGRCVQKMVREANVDGDRMMRRTEALMPPCEGPPLPLGQQLRFVREGRGSSWSLCLTYARRACSGLKQHEALPALSVLGVRGRDVLLCPLRLALPLLLVRPDRACCTKCRASRSCLSPTPAGRIRAAAPTHL